MSFIRTSIWLLLSLSLNTATAIAQDSQTSQTESKPFQLGIEQKDYISPQVPAVPAYGKPMMVGGTPNYATAPATRPPMNGGVQQNRPAVLNAGIQQNPPRQMQPQQPQMGILPPQFLGRWQVMGSRSKVEALPQFQAGMDSIFAMNTQNIWMIQGNPQQGYNLSTDQGVATSLLVQTTGDTAILKYQHPIKNTVAQEAVVMQLLPGGATFNGLERISIVKQGEGVRAKVEYNLVGHRQ